MFYHMNWYTHLDKGGPLLDAVIGAVQKHGGSIAPNDRGFDEVAFRLPFQLSQQQQQSLRPPLLWLGFHGGGISQEGLIIDLTCAEEVLSGPFARQNLERLVQLGDAIYDAIRPYYGWCNGEGELCSGGLDRFLRTGLPIYDQFTYVGAALRDRVDWEALGRRRVVRTDLADGGLRVERAPNRHLPRLDLPVDEPFGLLPADLV